MENVTTCKGCPNEVEPGRVSHAVYCVDCSFQLKREKRCIICGGKLPKKHSKYCKPKCSNTGQEYNRIKRFERRGNKWRPKNRKSNPNFPDDREELIRIITELGLDVGGFN